MHIDDGGLAPSRHRHFAAMDGIRGIAAMAVVLFHSPGGEDLILNGRLAVDMFFMLSGFVIAFSYEDRLASTMRRRDFLVARLIRLYPMLLVGAVGGLIIGLIHNRTNPGAAYPIDSVYVSGALSVFVLPYLGPELGETVFSFDPPIWSLFFELIANLIYVMLRRWLTIPVLMAVVVVSLIGIGLMGPLGGGAKQNILGGLPRIGSGFFGGVLLFKLWRAGRVPSVPANILLIGGFVVALLGVPVLVRGWLFLPAFAAMSVVMVLAIGDRPSGSERLFAFLGKVSYPIYMIHWLSLYMFSFLGRKMGIADTNMWIVTMLNVMCVPFIGFVLADYYERPVRRGLARIYARRSEARGEAGAGPGRDKLD